MNYYILVSLCIFINAGAFPVQDEEEAAMYLQKFGYIDTASDSYRTGAILGPDTVAIALKDFQRFAGLNQTGELDNETIAMMNTPRCGVKDIIGNSEYARRRKRYALQGSKWRVNHLTYRIHNYPTNLKDRQKIDKEISRAFKLWSDVTDLSFEERKRGRVNIEIRWEKREHGDGDPFDGPGRTLAHAFFPQFGGDAHFDDEEKWTIDERTGSNLFQVAAHEFGHSLGLSHSDEKRALMSPYYTGYRPALELTEDDTKGIQALYGTGDQLATPEEEVEEPSGPPPDTSDAPDLCQDASIDTVTRTQNMGTFVFKGDFYWRILADGIADGYPRRISDDWDGLEGNLDASLTWSNGKTYFFKGGRYWRFTNKTKDNGYPKLLSKGFEGIPSMMDAAFVWSGNGKTYFFKGKYYWRYDSNNDPPVSDKYPRPISHWNGLPDNINAAFQWENSKTYFFKGDKYYKFDDIRFEVDSSDPPYPRSTSVWWFDCKSISHETNSTGATVNATARENRAGNTYRVDSSSGTI
ncbi:matrix metalloproteinase-16-like [Uloborus diversus]|uniref:matrix metalloproteinase-16-like n=1 Tax=Uloborus diversus TaxID=327109 RepID=UPI00240941BD|nr:matrix metalloproteinase-16-like [Uloborus diversus]XP_054709701.1 matrix metalloproteinase-16-like [Uloborus diversus]